LRGNKQRPEINYGDTFTGVVCPSIFKLLMALVAVYNLECKHLDIITAFLNRKLNRKNIYVRKTGSGAGNLVSLKVFFGPGASFPPY